MVVQRAVKIPKQIYLFEKFLIRRKFLGFIEAPSRQLEFMQNITNLLRRI